MKIQTSSIYEDFSAGYVSSQFDDAAGFSYSILPLSFNLQQKGNSKLNTKGIYKYYVGDFVSGICINDNKQHNGIIKYLHYKPGTTKVQYTYILDNKTSQIIPLKADSVKKIKNDIISNRSLNYMLNNQNNIHQISVSEGINFSDLDDSSDDTNFGLDIHQYVYNCLKYKNIWEYIQIGDKVYIQYGIYNIEGKGTCLGICLEIKKTYILIGAENYITTIDNIQYKSDANDEKMSKISQDDLAQKIDNILNIYNNEHIGYWTLPANPDFSAIIRNWYKGISDAAPENVLKCFHCILGVGGYVRSLYSLDMSEWNIYDKIENYLVYIYPVCTLYKSEIKKSYKKLGI